MSEARTSIFLVGAVVLLAPLYLATASKLVDHDCFVMGEVADQVMGGATLYKTAWDNKPPLALLYYALPRAFARGSYPSIQLMLLVVVALQSAAILRLTEGERPWTRAMAAALPLLLPLQDFAFVWSSSEDIANLFAVPVIFASYRVAKRGGVRAAAGLVIGVSLVLATQARQTALLYGILPVVALARGGIPLAARARGFLWIAAGFLVGCTVIAAILVTYADWHGYLHTVFLAPRLYRGHYWEAVRGVFEARNLTVVGLLFASTAVLVARGAHRAFFLALGLVTLAVILSPMRPFLHYWKQSFPALYLVVPMAMTRVISPRRLRLCAATLLGYLLLNALLTCGYLGLVRTDLKGHRLRRELDLVVNAIRDHSDPGSTLFATGEYSAYLYFASGRPPANVYFWDLALQGSLLRLAPASSQEVFRAYRDRPPEIVVVEEASERAIRLGETQGSTEYKAWMRDLMAAGDYDCKARLEGYSIWRRRARSQSTDAEQAGSLDAGRAGNHRGAVDS